MSDSQTADIVSSTMSLAAALQDTPEWTEFRELATALPDDLISALRSANSALRAALASSEVDRYEPALALRRSAFREDSLREAIARLPQSARRYVDAFDAVNNLIDTAASAVFGQLVAHGVTELNAHDLQFGPQRRTVEFQLGNDNAVWVDPGLLCAVDDPLIGDALRVEGISLSHNNVDGTTLRVRAARLPNTEGVFTSVHRGDRG